MYYVYIIRSLTDKSNYVGYTLNLKQRMKDHNSGKNISTKGSRPWEIVTYIASSNKQKAIDFEGYLKSGSGKAFAKKRLQQ
jgi:predicted GIY-YIG superfamily endonuclease